MLERDALDFLISVTRSGKNGLEMSETIGGATGPLLWMTRETVKTPASRAISARTLREPGERRGLGAIEPCNVNAYTGRPGHAALRGRSGQPKLDRRLRLG